VAGGVHSSALIGGIESLPSNALAGLRILLLEDEYLIAMDVELLCRDSGAAEVVVKRSLEELDGMDGFDRFDVAVVDLVLAGTSTLPFAERLRENNVPFIFASGYADENLTSSFPDIRTVSKPYAGSDLVEAIAAAARRR
jgi:DNA-binding response OmpR family regulator